MGLAKSVDVPLLDVGAENPADMGVAKPARRVGVSDCAPTMNVQWDAVFDQQCERLEEEVHAMRQEVEPSKEGSGIKESIIKDQGKMKTGIRNITDMPKEGKLKIGVTDTKSLQSKSWTKICAMDREESIDTRHMAESFETSGGA